MDDLATRLPISPGCASTASWRRSAGVAAASGSWLAVARAARRPPARRGICCSPARQTVQTTPIVTTYPSQQYVVLNATGYVVAQRKAAISSKATGRLEWLGVAEGSRVKAGDVIARIDNRDVVAQAQSAEAAVRAARANVRQARGRARRTRDVEYRRNEDLVDKNFISQSALDTAKARLDRAQAGVASAQANLNVGARERAQRAGRGRLHARSARRSMA